MSNKKQIMSTPDDDCALPHALGLMGEKWSFMILRSAFDDIRHFEGFLNKIGLARNILANRLARLTEGGILARTPCPNDKRKVEYRLTQKGLDLLPVMIGLRQWGEKWATGTPSSPVLVDQSDKKPIQLITIRSHDDRVLTWQDLCWIDANKLETEQNSSDAESNQQLTYADEDNIEVVH